MAVLRPGGRTSRRAEAAPLAREAGPGRRPDAQPEAAGAQPLSLERAVRLGHSPATFSLPPHPPAAPQIAALGPGAVIQRLTGYEVEVRIPMFGDYVDGSAYVRAAYRDGFSPDLGHFLFGGLEYGARYGDDPLGHFTLSADHNEIKAAHLRLLDLLVLTGYIEPGHGARTMSSIEYITPPRDETGRSGSTLLKQDLLAVQEHANVSLHQARGNQVAPLPLTGDHALTGVPREALQAWILRHGGSWSLFESAVQTLEQTISDQGYVQQTTGVLPEDLPSLYSNASVQLEKGGSRTGQIEARALQLAPAIGLEAWQLAFAQVEPPAAFLLKKDAVVGYLSLLATYLLADSLSTTTFLGNDSAAKNLFSFLPRAKLAQSFSALPLEVQKERDAWQGLVEPLFAAAAPYGTLYWQTYGWLGPRPKTSQTAVFQETLGPEGGEKENDNDAKVGASRTNTREVLKLLFAGVDPDETFQRPLPDLDRPHELVEGATGQRAIPLEDRSYGEKVDGPVTFERLPEVLWRTFVESQKRLLLHVPEASAQLASEAEAPVDEQEVLRQSIARQGGYLEALSKELATKIAEADEVRLKAEARQEKLRLKLETIQVPKDDEAIAFVEDLSSDELDEDSFLTTREDIESAIGIMGEIVGEQGAKLQLLAELQAQVGKITSAPLDFGQDPRTLLEILRSRALQAQHLALRSAHALRPLAEGAPAFYESGQRLLNPPAVSLARSKLAKIQLDAIDPDPRVEVQLWIDKANEALKTFDLIKTLSPKKELGPQAASELLERAVLAGADFAQAAERAYELFEQHRKKH